MAEGLTNLTTMVSSCFSIITGNEILLTLFVATLAGSAFGVIRKAKGAAK